MDHYHGPISWLFDSYRCHHGSPSGRVRIGEGIRMFMTSHIRLAHAVVCCALCKQPTGHPIDMTGGSHHNPKTCKPLGYHPKFAKSDKSVRCSKHGKGPTPIPRYMRNGTTPAPYMVSDHVPSRFIPDIVGALMLNSNRTLLLHIPIRMFVMLIRLLVFTPTYTQRFWLFDLICFSI